jgi:hypothetical protein
MFVSFRSDLLGVLVIPAQKNRKAEFGIPAVSERPCGFSVPPSRVFSSIGYLLPAIGDETTALDLPSQDVAIQFNNITMLILWSCALP